MYLNTTFGGGGVKIEYQDAAVESPEYLVQTQRSEMRNLYRDKPRVEKMYVVTEDMDTKMCHTIHETIPFR